LCVSAKDEATAIDGVGTVVDVEKISSQSRIERMKSKEYFRQNEDKCIGKQINK
jgi:hypothetical protein